MTGRTVPFLTLATRVTLLRILGVPVFILLMVYYNMSLGAGEPNDRFRLAALVLFAAISLTDALDGYLARSRGEITRLGQALDPLADKLLLLSAVIMLTRPGLSSRHAQLPVWFALTVLSRDALLLIGFGVVHLVASRVDIRPRWTGKVATFLQMATVVWRLSISRHPSAAFLWVAAAAAFFTVVSGVRYIVDGLKQMEDQHHAQLAESGRK